MSNTEHDVDCCCRKSRRMFSPKELRVYVLSLLAGSSSYGYELIQRIKLATGSFYCPSSGVIYPTLTLLEEQTFIEPVNQSHGRKQFLITTEGKLFLATQTVILLNIKQKLQYARELKQGNAFADEIELAVSRFKSLLRHKIVLKQLSNDESVKIVNIINQTVQRLESMNLALIEVDN